MIKKVSVPTGIRCSQPRRIELPNDRTETYVNSTEKHFQIIVTIFPTLGDDRYAAVNRTVCTEAPCPSKCINSKTLRNEEKNRSIVQKILLQMNCKLSGALWGVKIPLKVTMIIGIDTYHEANNKDFCTAGFVATINSSFTKYFTNPAIQQKREE
jgi:aubergine